MIRVKLTQEPTLPPPAPPRLSKGALLLILGAVVVVLGWLAVRAFRAEPTLPVAATAEDSPVVSAAPVPKPAIETAPAAAKPTEPEAPPQPDPPTSAINKALPDVPSSALDTIRGTIRVSIRVTIDKAGTVVDTATDERGPSRYFARLAVDASKKWRFTPATSEESRPMLVKFYFTRTGVTAEASSPP